MKSRLLACAVATLLVLGTFTLVSARVRAQGGLPGQESQDSSHQNSQISMEIDKALEVYEERSGRNLDQCRKEMEQLRKELHELIDLRIKMALTLAEIRAKAAMKLSQAEVHTRSDTTSDTALRAQRQPQGNPYIGTNYPGTSAAKGYPNAWSGNRSQAYSTSLSSEVQQLHAQLRSEVDQQQSQVAQLVTQLRTLQDQLSQGQGSQSDQHKRTEVEKK